MFFFNDIQPIGNSTENSFDSIKQIDANGNEFWYARDLQTILEYTKWDNFLNVIEKAKISCISLLATPTCTIFPTSAKWSEIDNSLF